MTTLAKIIGSLILALLAYLLFWPIPISPVSVSLNAAPGYVGVHAANTRLVNLHSIKLKGDVGPEHIVFGPDGKLYTGVASGNILRMQADGSALEVFVNTGGRPLGLDFDAAGNLIAVDTVKGLISIAPDKTITVLAST